MHSFAWMDRGREECEDDSVCVCVCVCARTLTDKEYTGYMLIRYRIPYSTRTQRYRGESTCKVEWINWAGFNTIVY